MKDFVEIDVSTRQKNFQYLLIMISNSSKIALTKKILFPQAEHSFSLARQRILKNTLLLYGKHGFQFKKHLRKLKKIGVHQPANQFSLVKIRSVF